MKMYLSSYRLGDKPQELVNLVGENKKVAVIQNAMDIPIEPEAKKAGIQREIDDLKGLGFVPKVVDLKEYFGRPEELKKKMDEFGLIWVRGGNVFVLRRAYKESGMDEWVISQKDNRELVYAGYSAGVCVLSPSLKGLEIVDDPKTVTDGYKEETVWEGLGVVEFAFAPHYQSPHPESEAISRSVEYFIKNEIEYKALHDGEVIVIDDE